MQKNWRLVFFTTLGLAFNFFPIKGHGKLIWEKPEFQTAFSFSGYDKVFLFVSLGSDTREELLLNILKKALNKNGQVLVLQDLKKQTMEAMRESHLFLNVNVISTKDPNINGLKIAAKTNVRSLYNQSEAVASIWEEFYLFENIKELDKDITKTLKTSIPLFIFQYFQSNPQAKEKAIFYYPDQNTSRRKKN